MSPIRASKEHLSNEGAALVPIVPVGTLVMSFKLSIGRTAIAGTDLRTNEAIAAFTNLRDDLDVRYLGYALQQYDWGTGDGTNDKLMGATLNKAKLSNALIPIPPLDEQERIVAKLDALLARLSQLRGNVASRMDNASQLRLKMLEEIFSGPAPGVPMVPIGKLATWSGGLTPSTKTSRYWQGGTVPWISSQDVKSPILDGTSRLVTTSAVEESRLSLHPAGGVAVVVRSGVLAHTFPVAYVPFPATVNQDIKFGRPRPEVDGRYLAEALRASGSAILRKCMKEGATVQSVDVDRLMAFEIPLPSLGEQKRIVARMDESIALVHQLEMTHKALLSEVEHLRKAAVAELLAGKA